MTEAERQELAHKAALRVITLLDDDALAAMLVDVLKELSSRDNLVADGFLRIICTLGTLRILGIATVAVDFINATGEELEDLITRTITKEPKT